MQPIGAHCCEVMYFGYFEFRGDLGFLNCDDVCMCVVNKEFELLEFVFDSVYVDLQYDEISGILCGCGGCCCHLNGIYMGALAYADDITITCPSRRGLHKMLVLCNNFGNENYIIFNTKKTLCVKYGEPVNDHEYIYFNKIKLDWYDKVRHLGNFFSCNINDSTDITHKRSDFIGYFNKLMSNFAFIQPAILSNLFKHIVVHTMVQSFGIIIPMDLINTVYSGIHL